MRIFLFLALLGVCACSCSSQPATRSTPAEPVQSIDAAPSATVAAPSATVKDFYTRWSREGFRRIYECAYGGFEGMEEKIEQGVRDAVVKICAQFDCSERLSVGLDGPEWRVCQNDFRAMPCGEAMIAPASCEIELFQ